MYVFEGELLDERMYKYLILVTVVKLPSVKVIPVSPPNNMWQHQLPPPTPAHWMC